MCSMHIDIVCGGVARFMQIIRCIINKLFEELGNDVPDLQLDSVIYLAIFRFHGKVYILQLQ